MNEPVRDDSVEAAEAIQKIQVMNKKARTEMMDPMIEVPNARMKKMYAPPRKRVHSDTKSVYLVTFLMSVDG